MADLYRARIESIHDRLLTCRVTELYGDGFPLVNSRTLALGFLWDTLEWFWWWEHVPDCRDLSESQLRALAAATPLGRELADRDFGDEEWNRANVGRFISCVGVVDHESGLELDERASFDEYPQATYLIRVTDARLLGHLRVGDDWRSRVWDHDAPVTFDPGWRTPDVLAVARGIDASQDFGGMPVLADALQEAGCDCADILKHLRGPSAAHVRGCWALDLVLGKE